MNTAQLDAAARAVADYDILDTPTEGYYDNLVALAADLAGWPIAMLSFFDGERQWYKAAHGIEIVEVHPEHSFCLHTVGAKFAGQAPEPLFVPDAREDERFRENPHVTDDPRVRAYAGFPVQPHHADVPLGTLVLINTAPAELPAGVRAQLDRLVAQLEAHLTQRRDNVRLRAAAELAAGANERLRNLSYALAHDLRAPLQRQGALVGILREEAGEALPTEAAEVIGLIEAEAAKGGAMLRDLLTYLHAVAASSEEAERVDLRALAEEVAASVATGQRAVDLEVAPGSESVRAPRAALHHLLHNFMDNAVRHHDGPRVRLRVSAAREGDAYRLSVADDGPGIPAELLPRLQSGGTESRLSVGRGGGLGLKIVAQLARDLGGGVALTANAPRGTVATAWWPVRAVV